MSGWLNGIGDALTTAGKGVIGWEDEKRRAEQEAMQRALQNSTLDTQAQQRQLALAADARANTELKNKNAQTLLMDLPDTQMATPGQADAIRGSLYEGQLTPNQLTNRSTIGGMTMPGGSSSLHPQDTDPVSGVSVSQSETGPQNGAMMQPLVNPAIRIAQINAQSRNNLNDNMMDYRYANLGRQWDNQGNLGDARNLAAQAAMLRAMQGPNSAQDQAFRLMLEQMRLGGQQGKTDQGAYQAARREAAAELGKNPIAVFEPDYLDKVEQLAQQIMAGRPQQQAPTAPAPGVKPTAAPQGPGKRFTIVSVK